MFRFSSNVRKSKLRTKGVCFDKFVKIKNNFMFIRFVLRLYIQKVSGYVGVEPKTIML
jgi:hypothetical protein